MATAPRPPACVGSGTPVAQRRAAIDFLSRELRGLEIEVLQTRKLEERLAALDQELNQAKAAASMYMRRCDMLETELAQERALRLGADIPVHQPAEVETTSAAPRTVTSLVAAAAMLPPVPACACDTDVSPLPNVGGSGSNTWHEGAVGGSFPHAAQFDELEADVEALINAQRLLPSQGMSSRLARPPMRLPHGMTLSCPPPS